MKMVNVLLLSLGVVLLAFIPAPDSNFRRAPKDYIPRSWYSLSYF